MARTDSGPSDIERAVDTSRGHFLYESGHHGDLWLDLDALLIDARRTRGWALALAERAVACRPEFVCGPLTGGAFVAQLLAVEMGTGFVFAERFVSAGGSVRYRISGSLREALDCRRVLLVDDAVNAGSALLSTLADLLDCGADLAGFATLLALGEAPLRIAKERGVPLFALASLERRMWTAEECPLCRTGIPLIDHLARS